MKKLAILYGLNSKTLSNYYMTVTSDYARNKESYVDVSKVGLVYGEHLWRRLCLDEKDIWWSVYTIFSNPDKDKIIAILPGTKSKFIIDRMREEILEKELCKVKQICTDMSPTMECICNALFAKAELVTDRFHVMKNLLEDVGSVRIAIKSMIKNAESKRRKKSKKKGVKYKWKTLKNWETWKEAISRVSRQTKKRETDWTVNQKVRRQLLKQKKIFNKLIKIYAYLMEVWRWYDKKDQWKTKALLWIEKIIFDGELLWKEVAEAETMANTLSNRKESICNYFLHNHSNGYAEWLNSRIARLLSVSRGFKNKDYMLYRITQIFT